MIFGDGNKADKNNYITCGKCSESIDDLKEHYYYNTKKECQCCGKISLQLSRVFTPSITSSQPSTFFILF